MRSASTTLPAETSSVPTARHWVESLLTGWGEPAAGWTAACIISELATNACIHARTGFTVTVAHTPDDVLLQVSDGSPAVPQPRSYGDRATTGRGLHLVEAMSSSWGVELRPDGKTIWARLTLRTTDPDDSIDDVDALLARFEDVGADTGVATRRGDGTVRASGTAWLSAA